MTNPTNTTEEMSDIIMTSDDRNIQERVKDFSGLLNQIETLNDKKRKLWIEIYENAVSDRQNSYAIFSQLVKIVNGKSSEHAVHGKTIATYIERMSKANDQLIKLAELVAKAEKSNEEIDADEMYQRLTG